MDRGDYVRLETLFNSYLSDSDGDNKMSLRIKFGGAATITDNRKVVTAAGTREQLPDVTCSYVVIVGEEDNTGVVVIGGSTVVAAIATRRGIPLFPGQSIRLEVNNLNVLWIDSMVNGEGVTYATFV